MHNPGSTLNVMLWSVDAWPKGTTHYDLRQALEPGDVLQLQSGPGDVNVLATGYVFPD